MSNPTTAAEMPALAPCPFCGGEAELWRAHAGRTAWVACMGRCAVLVTKEHLTDAEAIAAWNRRALPSDDEMVEKVAAALCRTNPNYSTYHFPGDAPRKWRSPGGAIYDTHQLTPASCDVLRACARAALSAMRGEP